jgi:hypothetical protein
MKSLLFNAIPPDSRGSRPDWDAFLRAAALEQLLMGAEQLAPNVWVLPDDGQTYLILSRIGDRWSIATRTLPFSRASDWQPLSTPP